MLSIDADLAAMRQTLAELAGDDPELSTRVERVGRT